MKKALVILTLVFAGNAIACSQVEKKSEEKREVSSENSEKTWKEHQKYLEKIDKIR